MYIQLSICILLFLVYLLFLILLFYLCFCSVPVILLHCGSFCHKNKFLVCVNITANKAHSDSDFEISDSDSVTSKGTINFQWKGRAEWRGCAIPWNCLEYEACIWGYIYITWFKWPNSDFFSSYVAPIRYDPRICKQEESTLIRIFSDWIQAWFICRNKPDMNQLCAFASAM